LPSDGTATLLNGDASYVRNFKIHKQRPVLLPPKRELASKRASKRLSPNKL